MLINRLKIRRYLIQISFLGKTCVRKRNLVKMFYAKNLVKMFYGSSSMSDFKVLNMLLEISQRVVHVIVHSRLHHVVNNQNKCDLIFNFAKFYFLKKFRVAASTALHARICHSFLIKRENRHSEVVRTTTKL